MYVYLHNITVRYTYNGVTNGCQKCLKFVFVLLIERLLKHHDKFRAITKTDIGCFNLIQSHLACIACWCRRFYLCCKIIRCLNTCQAVICTLQYSHQTLTTGIHNTCLLQYRQHLRCQTQHVITILYDLTKTFFQIICCIKNIRCFLCHASCNCKNCTFLRLHNSLISSLACLLKCFCCDHTIDNFLVFDRACKTTE